MRVLIIGCGYIGLALGRELMTLGHAVTGVRRPSPTAAQEMAAAGIRAILADITTPGALPCAPEDFDVVVNCAAPKGGGEGYRAVYVNGSRNLVQWLSGAPPRLLVYTSSTGVYGQDDGSMVTEKSIAEPSSETGRVLVEAEQVLHGAHRLGSVKPIILRLAGTYGPGRGYWLRRLRSNEPPIQDEENDRIVNMIHRDDVVSAVISAIERGQPGESYNVVDDRPVSVGEMRMSRLFDRSAQGALLSTGTVSPARSHRPRATNKRVSNAKLKAMTSWRPKFPSFEEGFAYEAEKAV